MMNLMKNINNQLTPEDQANSIIDQIHAICKSNGTPEAALIEIEDLVTEHISKDAAALEREKVKGVEKTEPAKIRTTWEVIEEFGYCRHDDIDYEHCQRLMHEYAAQFQPKWLPITEAPKDGNEVLGGCWMHGTWQYHPTRFDGSLWECFASEHQPTHYLIPSPPTTQKP